MRKQGSQDNGWPALDSQGIVFRVVKTKDVIIKYYQTLFMDLLGRQKNGFQGEG
jgi:hypothetical protein